MTIHCICGAGASGSGGYCGAAGKQADRRLEGRRGDREEGCWGTRNGKRVISGGRTGGCRCCDSSNGDNQMEKWMEGRWPSRVIVLGVALRGWLKREGKKC